MVGVEERVDGRVNVCEDDGEVHAALGHGARLAKRLHAVDRVEREPTDHEEKHDDTQTLGCLHLTTAGVCHLRGGRG